MKNALAEAMSELPKIPVSVITTPAAQSMPAERSNAVILNHDSKNNSSSSFSCSETDTKPFNSTACVNCRVKFLEAGLSECER